MVQPISMEAGAVSRALSRRARRMRALYQRIAATQLLLFLVGSVASSGSYRVGDINLSLLGASACFGIALLLQLVASRLGEDEAWRQLRTVAEEIKGLSWLYAVGGEPFGRWAGDRELAEATLAKRIDELVYTMDRDAGTNYPFPPIKSEDTLISPAMREIRATPLEERQFVYANSRIDDQFAYYRVMAVRFRARARFWTMATLFLQALVVVGLAMRALDVVTFDLYTVAGALGGAGATYLQSGQFSRLSKDYARSSRKLASLREQFRHMTGLPEEAWASAVKEAEELISNTVRS